MAPGAFTGLFLNAPTPGTSSEPVPALTLTATYSANQLYYGELAETPGDLWEYILFLKPLAPFQGYNGLGLGVRMVDTTYYGGLLVNSQATLTRSLQVNSYDAAGTYTGTSAPPNPPAAAYYSAWEGGVYLKVGYNAATNVTGTGLGDVTTALSTDGYNWSTQAAIKGSAAAHGGIAGIGFGFQLSNGAAGVPVTMYLGSLERTV